MNQIPNIEEVGAFPNDPTGLRREFAIMFHRGDFIKDGKDNSELISDWFHHQLQKARHDWLREVEKVQENCICKDKGVIELLEEQNKEARQKIASLYLPAHEVNHGKDCIECKEIAAYNAALQDAIQAVTLSYHSELDQDKV
jgi:hypothetical protein